MLRLKPHTCQRCSEGSNIPCVHRTRDPTETETERCLSVSCGGTGQQWPAAGAGALGASDLGMALALLEEVAINPTTEPPEQDCGNRLLEGTSRTLCTRTQEKGAVTPQGTDPDLPECPGVTGGGVGQWWPAAGSGALSVAVGPFSQVHTEPSPR